MVKDIVKDTFYECNWRYILRTLDLDLEIAACKMLDVDVGVAPPRGVKITLHAPAKIKCHLDLPAKTTLLSRQQTTTTWKYGTTLVPMMSNRQ